MHELTLAAEVVNLAEEELGKAAGTILQEIEIEIGEGSCIDREAFNFALSLALKEAGRINTRVCLKIMPDSTDIRIISLLIE